MAEADGRVDPVAPAATGDPPVDWPARIRERLAGSRPRHSADDWLVPGLTAEQSRAFRRFFPAEPIPAAVLVPIVEHPGAPTVLLTQRATQLRHHAGQISFPGGRIETHDESPAAAALREAREEIGLEQSCVSVAGFLPDHVVISGFRVTPVVGMVRPGFELFLDAQEVQDTFEVPLDFVFDPRNHRPRLHRFRSTEAEAEMLDIPYGKRNIWGATAGMLVTLYRLCTEGEV
ncbi:MAG TPA: CoA pyrophosphatase [Steroidobacteraceae bacterium]|nr:CoA pyrophosphatase [Steroidobacteraceae bacterium]